MAKPILEILGELPSGKVVPLSVTDLGKYLRDNYLQNQGEADRMRRASRRLDLYHDRGQRQFAEMVDEIFVHPEIRAERKKFIKYATFQNVSKRIVDEISTVYSEAASRSVSEEDMAAYTELLAHPGVRVDSVMRKANRYTNLLNEALVWFWVRTFDMEPQLRVFTPDTFYAVGHPLDPTRLVAIVFPIARLGFVANPSMPKWQCWTEWETFQLDGNAMIMSESYQEHGLGRIPGVLLHREPPDEDLLDSCSGDDISVAHKTVTLLNIMMIKEQKSGTRQPYVAGDIGNTATGQPLDSERLTVFQDGVAPGILDMGADPQSYITSADATIRQVAANYGISEAVFNLSFQAASGFEIELKRAALMEKRHQQIMDPYRPAERELAEVMSIVTAKHKPGLSFAMEEWSIDFGEIDTPRSPAERLNYWKQMREMTLLTTYDMMQELNPEFTTEQASEKVRANIVAETERVEMLRMLQSLQGSPSTSAEPQMDDGPMMDERVSQPRSGPPPVQ